MQTITRTIQRFAAVGLALVVGAGSAAAQHYTRMDLVTNATDADLVNAWGLSRASGSPWWVADNGTSKSTLYDGAGVKQKLIVGVPTDPTGTVFNGTTDFKRPSDGKPSVFIFASESGGITSWTPGTTETVLVAGSPNAVYKGLAIASFDHANYLYATNFHSGRIEIFDANFAPVHLREDRFRLEGDGHGKLVPFNVQNIGGNLFVTFAKQGDAKHDEVDGAGLGAVAAFSPEGHLLKVFERGWWLNAPWGLTLAPGDFGKFSHSLLVGQFGSGQVAAYNIITGQFLGLMEDASGNALNIDGLWGLGFGNDAAAGPATTLYFSAGPNGESGGTFGTLTPVSTDQLLGNGN
jgi:uncharacterized protein (TIGR03118 family)